MSVPRAQERFVDMPWVRRSETPPDLALRDGATAASTRLQGESSTDSSSRFFRSLHVSELKQAFAFSKRAEPQVGGARVCIIVSFACFFLDPRRFLLPFVTVRFGSYVEPMAFVAG